MLSFLVSLCVFFISLTSTSGELLLTDKNGSTTVKNNFVYENSYYKWEVETVPYWTNSVETLSLFFFADVMCLHWKDRENAHLGDWTLTIIHNETGEVFTRKLTKTGFWWIYLHQGENTYSFTAEKTPAIGLFKLEVPRALYVNLTKK